MLNNQVKVISDALEVVVINRLISSSFFHICKFSLKCGDIIQIIMILPRSLLLLTIDNWITMLRVKYTPTFKQMDKKLFEKQDDIN